MTPEGKKIVLAVASGWGKMKGYDDVIELSRRLNEEYVVVIVGVTEAQKEALKAERMIAITRTDNQKQLAELYSASHVFINTTYEENYPTVNMEALCCGCPVITYATGGSVETISEKTGIVVPRGNVDAMLEAITAIDLKHYDRNEISQNARAEHSKEDMANQYLSLYEEMIGCDRIY